MDSMKLPTIPKGHQRYQVCKDEDHEGRLVLCISSGKLDATIENVKGREEEDEAIPVVGIELYDEFIDGLINYLQRIKEYINDKNIL